MHVPRDTGERWAGQLEISEKDVPRLKIEAESRGIAQYVALGGEHASGYMSHMHTRWSVVDTRDGQRSDPRPSEGIHEGSHGIHEVTEDG